MELYYNDQWNDWVSSGASLSDLTTLLLYSYGVSNEDITGGWQLIKYSGSGYSPSLTYNSNYMRFTQSDKSGGTNVSRMVSINKIDLTDYDTLVVKHKTNTNASGTYGWNNIQILSDIKSNTSVEVKSLSLSENSSNIATNSLDISDLTGSYYIAFKAWWAYSDIYEISLKYSL